MKKLNLETDGGRGKSTRGYKYQVKRVKVPGGGSKSTEGGSMVVWGAFWHPFGPFGFPFATLSVDMGFFWHPVGRIGFHFGIRLPFRPLFACFLSFWGPCWYSVVSYLFVRALIRKAPAENRGHLQQRKYSSIALHRSRARSETLQHANKISRYIHMLYMALRIMFENYTSNILLDAKNTKHQQVSSISTCGALRYL